MDFTAGSRVKVAKYGKNRNRAQLHNLYDISASTTTIPPASKRLPISPASTGTEQQIRDIQDVPINPPSPSPIRSPRPAHVTSHSRSSLTTSHGSRSVSPTKHEAQHPMDAQRSTLDILTSAFDMPTSDDDSDPAEQRPVKKLKLSPAQNEKKRDTAKTASSRLEKSKRVNGSVSGLKQKDVNQKPSQEKAKVKSVRKKRSSEDMMQLAADVETTVPAAVAQPESRPVKMARNERSSAPSKNELPDEKTRKPQSIPQKSRTKLKSRLVGNITPQKPRQRGDNSDTSCASPSQLAMDNLTLTRETSPELKEMNTTASVIEPSRLLPRAKTRRIDRLDAGASQPAPRAEQAAKNFASKLESLQRGAEFEKPMIALERPNLVRIGSSETRQTYGRSRNTYAKERSHLSDMLDDLDNASNDGNQGTSQPLLSGLMISGPSQLQSQLEFESDSSDGAPAQRLKSIHELRQAGANNRLEKEVEDLMVDINPTSGTKAVRISALVQVMRKMSQERFAAFLLDHALERLTEWSPSMKDKISKLLLGMILWRLVHCGTISPTRLKQIIHCVVSNSSTLPPLDTISHIVKSRAENLSKSTIRDLIEFEQTIITDGLLPAYEGQDVIPAAVTLGVLNDSLRKMIGAGSLTPLPRSSYPQIIALLGQVSQSSGGHVVKHVFVTKLALSLLRICVGPLEQDLALSQSEYQALGETLTSILDRSMNVHEDLVQAVLHFAITLTNDKPDICQIFCQSNLVVSLMTLISSRFLEFMETANESQEAEAGKLDSIILTLACLLNITEHDNKVRRAFATSTLADSHTTHLSRLVGIYMSAPRLQAVKTTAQTSGLISVGYLSLLICNLCLDEGLWQDVSDQLSGHFGISDVVASAKELLIHLRTLDNTDENISSETADDGITMRFGEILSAVRLE